MSSKHPANEAIGPQINHTSGFTVDSAMVVHSTLGPGLLESTYPSCLAHELRKRGANVQTQIHLPITYDGVEIEPAYRIDLLVSQEVIVEVKAVLQLHPVHRAQLLSYLKLSRRRVGLLINFNVLHLRDGIIRLVN